MSASQPAFPPAGNPDRRPLPDGWITRWDENYRAWYYVDIRTQPPRSSWEHPVGPLSSPQQPPTYAPPSNPPSNRFNSGSPSFPSQYGGAPQQYTQTTYPSGFQGGQQQDQRNFPGVPQQPYQAAPYGYSGQGQGWSQSQGGWQQSQPPSQVYAQPQPPRGRGGPGMGTALLAGGAGLVGGALLMDAFEHHEDREREEAYDQGFDNGQNDQDGGNFDNGGDGGGDW